jgi:hypothetical protein
MLDGRQFAVQVAKIVVGFIIALMGAAFFLAWGFFQSAGSGDDPVAFAAMIGTGLVTASVLGGVAMVPAFLGIACAELFGLRSFVYHVGVAGFIAFVMWSFDAGTAEGSLRPGTSIALAAGFLGGVIYWLIAGRTSGRWRGQR